MKQLYLFLMLICFFANSVCAQERTIKGTVTNASGEAMLGVTVTVRSDKGPSFSTVTDNAGAYVIKVPAGVKDLVFTYVGMKTIYAEIRGRNLINITLTPDGAEMEQVVVTALGIKREAKALTYSQQGVDVNTLTETRDPNLVNALSGKVAGLQVVPSGFNTGSARVIIRGNSSLTGNNQPLFVVDGMPIDNSAGDDGSIDYGNNAADINPEDIASIQVLKGPNAAALYGSRAANGVILITTKGGSMKFRVTVNSSMMFQTITELPEYQNAYGVGTSFYIDRTHRIPEAVANYRSWGSPMLGQPYVAINGEVKPYLPQPDNVKDFYTTAHLFTNSVAVEGGNTSATYRLGYTNYKGTSVVEGFNINNKHSLDLRLQNNFSPKVSLNTKINFVRNAVHNRQYSNSNGRNPTYMYVQMARSTNLDELLPYEDPATGTEVGTHRNFSNPYWIINKNPNDDTKDRIIAMLNPEVKLLPWMKLTGRIGADIYWWSGYEFNDIGSVITSNPNGYMRTFNTNAQNFNLEGILSINKKFNKFSVFANLGASSFKTNYERRDERINSLLQPGLINLSNAREYPVTSQNRRDKKINSAFGSLSLGYRDFAFIDITARNDWSSTLPAANNSYFYPSFGTSVILTDMFKIKSNFLSFAKARASIAVVGNDTDPYSLQQTFSFNGFFNDAPLASVSTTMNNPDLKPERTSSTEFGLDLRLFKSRLIIDATHYSAATTNQIIAAELPSTSGFKERLYNAGEIKNWGNELSITAKVIDKKDFSWDAQINYAKNNSLVVSLVDSVNRFVLNHSSSYLYVYAEIGKPYGYLRGLGAARDADGHRLLDDGGGIYTKDFDMPFGTANPDWIAGFRNTFRYKNFSLSLLLDIKKGGVIYSRSYSLMLTNGVTAETLYGRDDYYKHSVIFGESSSELSGGAMVDAYFADGTKNDKFISPQSFEYVRPNFAEFSTFDASYVKLREISLGYSIAPKVLAKTPIKSARVSLAGRNLALFSRKTPLGLDPEAASTSGNGQGIESGALPPNAIYGFNISLTF
jgi:TonB-linked SusC/RagA family outer membrane protein